MDKFAGPVLYTTDAINMPLCLTANSCRCFLLGLALGEPKYLDLWKKLSPEPGGDEVERNVALTQPVLWLN